MDISDEDYQKNAALLWDLYRNIRYASKRMGWFDLVYRLSIWATTLCGTAAFAAFAGEWKTTGLIVSGIAAFLSSLCGIFEYRPRALLYREARRQYREILADCEGAGSLEMNDADRRKLRRKFQKTEAEIEAEAPITLLLLMNYCENEAALCDFEEPLEIQNEIPRWAILIRQISPWQWPAKSIKKETSSIS